MPEPETPEAIRSHLLYLELLQRQNKQYHELLNRFGTIDLEITEFLNRASSVAAARDPRFILNPELVVDLRKKDPTLYSKLEPTYTKFLKEKAGLL